VEETEVEETEVLPELMLRGLEEVGVTQDVALQEHLQQELLGVTLVGTLLVCQVVDLLVLVLEEVPLDEQWWEVVEGAVELDNPLVLQQEELLGEELKTTPPQKLTPCCRPFVPFAQLAMITGRLWPNCIAIAMQFAAGLLSP